MVSFFVCLLSLYFYIFIGYASFGIIPRVDFVRHVGLLLQLNLIGYVS